MKHETLYFESLEIWKVSATLSNQIWHIVQKWQPLAKQTIGTQIIRSADSIGANIAEGSGRKMGKEDVYFLRVARGSLYETKNWLIQAKTRELISATIFEELAFMLNKLAPMLNAYIRYKTEQPQHSKQSK